MTNSSKVSVVIPTFNRGYCLSLAISSVLAQTYAFIEIIIVDDNSSDNTTLLCQKFIDEFGDKIKYVRNENNLGPSQSRNIGINKATGKYITFLDSDDLYYTDKIQLQVDKMESDPSIGFCYGHFATAHDIFVPSLFHYNNATPPLNLYPEFLYPNNFYIVTPAVMLRADLLKKMGGFDSSMNVCEDLELWSRILQKTKADCITKPIVIIHIRKDENIFFMKNILARDQLYERVFSRDYTLTEKFKKQLYSDLVDMYLSIAAANSNYREVVKTLIAMRKACKKPYKSMRDEIVKLALQSNADN